MFIDGSDFTIGYDASNSFIQLNGSTNRIQSTNVDFLTQMGTHTHTMQMTNGHILSYQSGMQFTDTTEAVAGATRTILMRSGTAPSTNKGDMAWMYVADQTAGNACFHTRTELGDVIKLFKGAALTTADATLATAITRIAELEARLQANGLLA